MKGVKSILYVILFMMVIVAICEGFNIYAHIVDKKDKKEWQKQKDFEMGLIKKYIKVTSDIDIDSLLSSEKVWNDAFYQRAQDFVENESSPRSGKIYIVTNRKK